MLKTKIAKSEDILFSSEIQNAVRSELDKMLAAPFFAQSTRCKRFLSHVVEQTLSGNACQLKERTIGISVFERANDYDTGQDAIVRVTANEVRKRIGQFYQESQDIHLIQIDLPRGTYIPEFRVHLAAQDAGTLNSMVSGAPPGELPQSAPPSPIEAKARSATAPDEPTGSPANTPTAATQQKPIFLRPWVAVALPLLILVTVALLAEILRLGGRSRIPEIWDPFLQSKIPVLVCLGTHDFHDANTPSAVETEDVVMRQETIPIDDVSVVTSMARLLGNKGIPFRLAAADQTSLADLQSQPVILIGAVDNKWTLQLTQALRYRVAVEFPSGQNKPPVATIVDAEQPTHGAWKTDFSIPLTAWKSDYAIVARENDATIGVPVFIEAGLGNTGSLAASRFVTSGALTSALQNERSCKAKTNFEAVIGTEITNGKPGSPYILGIVCW